MDDSRARQIVENDLRFESIDVNLGTETDGISFSRSGLVSSVD